ncbi:MAG: prepilin-type N-terminal cleavage/methylation domain-containing protein [Candidatus Paceibacterota bacterium]
MYKALTQKSGFTLVEVIIVSAISVLIFGAMFASFQYSLRLINLSRSKLSAISVANDRMEYFRSLPYNNVGTIAGIPPGTIPQNNIISLNGIEFNERVLVEYVDDPADGLNVADTNGIPSDYKRVKVEYTWEINGVNGQIALISNIVPRSIETTAGGGTVRINVIDDQSNLLPGARVRLTNASSTSPIDVTKITDVNGEALFSGTPVDSNYEVSVTGPIAGKSYSVDKTYEATTTNPNPSLSPFSVLESDISTLTFQIGELSDINLVLKSSVTDSRFVEDFTSLGGITSYSSVASNGDELVLSDTAGVYDVYGEVYFEVIPTAIEAWQAVRVAANVPADTDYKVYFYTGAGAGPYTIIPDTDLPGNSGGFADSIIDISNLSPTLYPSFVVGVVLETSDVSVTPIIDEVGVYYREAETLMTNQSMGVRGSKIIGTDATANFIYKYDVSTTTDVNGEITGGG